MSSKLIVVAVRDSAVNAFSRPFFTPALGVAQRSFADEVNRESQDNPMFQHPADFELWVLGEWDEDTGAFLNAEPARMLSRAADVKVK